MRDNNNPKTELTYEDLIFIFLSKKKLIILSTLAIGLITGIIVFFILDPIFLSSATIKSISKSGGINTLLGVDAIPDLSDIGNLGGGSVTKELALYENILVSRRCVEEAIVKFNIFEEEKFKYMYDATKYFRENVMIITKDKIAGTMEIGAFDKDPVKAKDIADFLVYQLNKINTELNIQNAKNNKEFIQNRYNESKDDLTKLEDSLKRFQDVFGIAPDIQVQAAVKAEIELESEIKSEEIKLALLRKILSPDQAEIKSLEEQITEMKKQLSEVRNNNDAQDVLTLKGKPLIILNYLRLKREVEIQNKVMATLIPLLEQSKIEEKRETPSVIVLDEPKVPEKKKKPKRIISILASMFVTFVFLSVSTVVYESFYKQLSYKLRNNV